MDDARYGLYISLWRSFVPFFVSFSSVSAARIGLDLDEDTLSSFLVLSGGGVYNAVVRWLEHHRHFRWGWLLGYPCAPTYACRVSKTDQDTEVS